MKAVFLTMRNLHELYPEEKHGKSDGPLVAALESLGWTVDQSTPWQDALTSAMTADADLVMTRTTWDYQYTPDLFIETLFSIQQRYPKVQLGNDPAIVKWNMSKRYLKDLQDAGIPIVPTVFSGTTTTTTTTITKTENNNAALTSPPSSSSLQDVINNAFSLFNTHEMVIKPMISAGSEFTYKISKEKLKSERNNPQFAWEDSRNNAIPETKDCQTFADLLELVFNNKKDERPFLIQPFLNSICDIGEFSVYVFGKTVTHVLRKRPAKGDFRVQSAYGGCETRFEAHEDPQRYQAAVALAGRISDAIESLFCCSSSSSLSAAPPPPATSPHSSSPLLLVSHPVPAPMYMRVDVIFDGFTALCMEAELIEPSFFFQIAPDAAAVAADEINKLVYKRKADHETRNDEKSN